MDGPGEEDGNPEDGLVVRLKGSIFTIPNSCPCEWHFKGRVTIDTDKFDFNDPLDPDRTGPGRVITTGVWLLEQTTGGGSNFNIEFNGSREVEASGTCPRHIANDLWEG